MDHKWQVHGCDLIHDGGLVDSFDSNADAWDFLDTIMDELRSPKQHLAEHKWRWSINRWNWHDQH
jgi:hypothetical protein